MSVFTPFDGLAPTACHRRATVAPAGGVRLCVEGLEDRTVPSATRADDLLSAVPPITGAAVQVQVVAVQAQADADIARINADTAVRITQITADISVRLAAAQAAVAEAQAQAAAAVNETNQDGVTARLGMQLAE